MDVLLGHHFHDEGMLVMRSNPDGLAVRVEWTRDRSPPDRSNRIGVGPVWRQTRPLRGTRQTLPGRDRTMPAAVPPEPPRFISKLHETPGS